MKRYHYMQRITQTALYIHTYLYILPHIFTALVNVGPFLTSADLVE